MKKNCTSCNQKKKVKDFYFTKNKPMSRCKICVKSKVTTYYKNNSVDRKKYRMDRYFKNKEKELQGMKEYREGEAREQLLASKRRYRIKNWEKIKPIKAADCAKRRASILLASPKWANDKAIKKIYLERALIEIKTGIKHHVDHIYPLKGKKVCGLHVANNLRIIPAKENVRKSARSPEDFYVPQT